MDICVLLGYTVGIFIIKKNEIKYGKSNTQTTGSFKTSVKLVELISKQIKFNLIIYMYSSTQT